MYVKFCMGINHKPTYKLHMKLMSVIRNVAVVPNLEFLCVYIHWFRVSVNLTTRIYINRSLKEKRHRDIFSEFLLDGLFSYSFQLRRIIGWLWTVNCKRYRRRQPGTSSKEYCSSRLEVLRRTTEISSQDRVYHYTNIL
jgi:hypothetical protein